MLKRAEVPGPETKSCAPVPREFRIKVVDSSNYLTGLAENDEQKLTTTPNYNEAVASDQHQEETGRSHLSVRTGERFTAIKTSEAAAMDRFTSTI